MENMANVVTVAGVLTSDVNLTFNEGKKAYVGRFYLKNKTRVGENAYDNDFYVVVYGKRAEHCAQHLSFGKTCTVTGKMSTWNKYDKVGNSQAGVTVIASEVYFEEDNSIIELNENKTS